MWDAAYLTDGCIATVIDAWVVYVCALLRNSVMVQSDSLRLTISSLMECQESNDMCKLLLQMTHALHSYGTSYEINQYDDPFGNI